MAIKYGFFDASYDEQTGVYDRQYFSEDMAKLFSVITGNGVFRNDRNALEVIANGMGMNVSVSTGFAIALGRYLDNTEPYNLTLTAPSANSKIDMIVARMSTASNERNFQLIVKEGTPSVNPQPPSLVRSDGVYELCLAKITLNSNTVVITQEIVEDTRANTELCGFVSGIGSGGSEFMNCTINGSVVVYSSAWLLDEEGNEFQPEANKVYRVITDGKYKNCIYVYNEDDMVYEGVGSYNIEMTVQEAVSLWDSSSFSRLENIPAPASVLQYNGQVVSPAWLYYDPTKLRIGGTTSAVNAGSYYATFEPINGYSWPDGSVTVKSIMWTISKKLVPIPIPLQTIFNYDGNEKTVQFDNIDTGSVTITNANATNTGKYVVTATLRDPLNCFWSDGTYVQRSWEYEIIGMQNTVTLSKNVVEFDTSSDTDTVTVISTSSGEVSVESSDINIVQATVNGSTITLTPGSSLVKGTATVTVNVNGGSTYAPGVATITVNKKYGITFVSWSEGSDEDILGMVQAADNGDIDLHDYWNVGDEREVRLSAITASGTNTYGSWSVNESHIEQTITLVLMDADKYDLTTPVLDLEKNPRYKCSFVVGMKNALIEKGRINSNTGDTIIWSTPTERADWCNSAFIGALPQYIAQMFKSFRVASNGTNYNDNIEYTDDLFTLFSAKEITGVGTGYESNVLNQLEYYKTSANRIKKLGESGSDVEYWTRTIQLYVSGSGGSAIRNRKATYITSGGIEFVPTSSDGTYLNRDHAISVYGCI